MSDKLFDFYIKEAETDFQGWDFSYIESRIVYSPLPWGYCSLVLPYILNSESLLDIGTGGGEFLSDLPLPQKTFATESHKPNIMIAKDRLEPLGVNVVQINKQGDLPFEEEIFDLVIDKHESFSALDVYRVLKTDHIFLTQQVGTNDGLEINKALQGPDPDEYDPNFSLNSLVQSLEKVGFEILRKEETKSLTRIFDIGAFVYYLNAIPWQFPNFSVIEYLPALKKLHNKLESRGYFDFTSERQLVICRKG